MKTFKPFQIKDIQAMESIGNSVCNSDAGTGKTAIGIGLITGRTLIIVPKSVIFQYADEIQAFRPDIIPTVITGTMLERKKLYTQASDVLLCTYEHIRLDHATIAGLLPFNTLIMDECHRLASVKTQLHKTLKALLKYYASKGYKPRIYGTTASLLMNSPMDIFGVFNILKPGLFPNWFAFVQKYMVKNHMGWTVGARASELANLGNIINPYLVKRTLAEVAGELPPHIDQSIVFELSKEERKLYDQIRTELLMDIKPNDIDKIKNPMGLQQALVKMGKLSELTNSPELIGSSGIESTKIEVLKDKLEEVLKDNNRKAVVYSRFSRMINILESLLTEYNPVKIIGDLTMQERADNIKKFKTDPFCRVMLMTTAGSEGVSLEEASYLFRLDTPFSIGRNIQLDGRIRRLTTIEPTFSYTLVAKKTVDEKIIKLLQKKREMQETIFHWEDINLLLT